MLEFLAELLGELVLGTILNWVLTLAYVLLRTATWLALYPFLLLLGWGWLSWRGRSSVGWLLVWQGRGPQALYRVGRWQAHLVGHLLLAALLPALAAVRRVVEGLLAALLLALAAAGVAAVLYGLAQHVGL
jgi:hypothetical protein